MYIYIYIYIICILKYRYYLGRQLLQRRCIYIYMYIALGICIGGFCYWTARSPFASHGSSSGTLFLAYFMVSCCIDAQNKAVQLFGKVA